MKVEVTKIKLKMLTYVSWEITLIKMGIHVYTGMNENKQVYELLALVLLFF